MKWGRRVIKSSGIDSRLHFYIPVRPDMCKLLVIKHSRMFLYWYHLEVLVNVFSRLGGATDFSWMIHKNFGWLHLDQGSGTLCCECLCYLFFHFTVYTVYTHPHTHTNVANLLDTCSLYLYWSAILLDTTWWFIIRHDSWLLLCMTLCPEPDHYFGDGTLVKHLYRCIKYSYRSRAFDWGKMWSQ